MTEFTPGPLDAESQYPNLATQSDWWIVDRSSGLVLGKAYHQIESDIRAPAAANACLWAAAPDLLEALDFCETALSPNMADQTCGDASVDGRRCGECLGCMNQAAWSRAATAIAKARGAS